MDSLFRYARFQLATKNHFSFCDDTCSMGKYADAMGESILIGLQNHMERLCGFRLYPCYSFLRFYTPESRLPRHVDRPSCEISSTITVGYESDQIWPIFVETGSRVRQFSLDVGDMLVYRGPSVWHWREPLQSGYWLQLFLHYVEADGEYANYRYDKRQRIGPTA